jgi:hypothetical protein
MLILSFTNPGLRTLSGQRVTPEAIVGFANAGQFVGIEGPLAVKVVFSYDDVQKGINYKAITAKIQAALDPSFPQKLVKVRYDLAPKPYVPAPKPVEAKPKGTRKPKAVA